VRPERVPERGQHSAPDRRPDQHRRVEHPGRDGGDARRVGGDVAGEGKHPGQEDSDPAALARCAADGGGLQILYAGKAHPRDVPAKYLIRHIYAVAAEIKSDALKIVYLENYDWELGALLTAGVDLWLNTPERPHEASGTSGMKAALNGVPSLSVLDGWWVEGCIEGFTGWEIPDKENPQEEAAALYERLQSTILPLYYDRPEEWRKLMRWAAALNGSFFNTHRMLQQYVADAYYPEKNINVSAAALESALAH